MSSFRWIVLGLILLFLPLQIVAVEVIEISRSSVFKSKVKKSNCIYDIRCEVDLGNDTVFLPEKSILRFTEGMIKNGTLIGNHTMLDNPANLPIFDAVDIGSTPFQYINDVIYVDWFYGNSDADKTQAAIDFSKKNRNAINFLSRQYVFNHTVVIPMGHVVLRGTGGGGEYQDLGTKIVSASDFSSDYEGSPLFYVSGEPKNADQTLGLISGHITGITFSTNKKHEVFQLLL